MTRYNIMLCAILIACVSACTMLENYRFGDITRTALTTANQVVLLKKDYCSDLNAPAREVLLNSIRLIEPTYDGVCYDAERENSSDRKDKSSSGATSSASLTGFYEYVEPRDSNASERLRFGISEVRLRAGHYIWHEGVHGVLYTRHRLHSGQNSGRQERWGYALSDEYDGAYSDAKRAYQYNVEAFSETPRIIVL